MNLKAQFIAKHNMFTRIFRMLMLKKIFLTIVICVILLDMVNLSKCDMVYLSSTNAEASSSFLPSGTYGGNFMNINKRG